MNPILELGRALRVLVVDEDPNVLTRSCQRLITLGCDVSTARSSEHLFERVRREHPDLVILDVLAQTLRGDELFLLLARCRPHALPAVIVHTRVSPALLPRVVDVQDLLGVVRKTDDDEEFFDSFRSILEKVAGLTHSAPAQSARGAASGEFVIGRVEAVPSEAAGEWPGSTASRRSR